MSSAIIRFESTPERLVYWKDHSYPTGLGFHLMDCLDNGDIEKAFEDKTKYDVVTEVPKDIQYEYTVLKDNTVKCQECWFTPDISYHGGGFRRGGIYDLRYHKEREERIKQNTIRNY